MLTAKRIAEKKARHARRRKELSKLHLAEGEAMLQGGKFGLQSVANRQRRKARINRTHHLVKEKVK